MRAPKDSDAEISDAREPRFAVLARDRDLAALVGVALKGALPDSPLLNFETLPEADATDILVLRPAETDFRDVVDALRRGFTVVAVTSADRPLPAELAGPQLLAAQDPINLGSLALKLDEAREQSLRSRQSGGTGSHNVRSGGASSPGLDSGDYDSGDLDTGNAKSRGSGSGNSDRPQAEPSGFDAALSSPWLRYPHIPLFLEPIIDAATRLTAPILILGEFGTGRRNLAEAIVAVSGAVPAHRNHTPTTLRLHSDVELGRFLANGGDALVGRTVIIHELDRRPADLQQRVADLLARGYDGRLVVTGNPGFGQDESLSDAGSELLHRFGSLGLSLPALRERGREVEDLVAVLSKQIAAQLRIPAPRFSAEALAALVAYPWPGNVAELEAVVTRTLVAQASDLAATEATAGTIQPRIIEAAELEFLPALRARRTGPSGSASTAASDALATTSGAKRSATQTAVNTAVEKSDAKSGGDTRENAAGKTVGKAAVRGATAPIVRLDEHARPAVAARPEAPESASAPESAHGTSEAIIAALAHDLRNPMTSVRTFASLVASSEGVDEDLASLATHASDALGRMDRHIDRLHEFAALEDDASAAHENMEVLALFADELAKRDESLSQRIEIAARADLEMLVAPESARFLVATVMDELEARLPDDGRASIELSGGGPPKIKARRGSSYSAPGGSTGSPRNAPAAGPPALLITIPDADRAPTQHLSHLAAGQETSWRLMLAGLVAARLGTRLETDFDGSTLILRWILALEAEETLHAEKTNSPRR